MLRPKLAQVRSNGSGFSCRRGTVGSNDTTRACEGSCSAAVGAVAPLALVDRQVLGAMSNAAGGGHPWTAACGLALAPRKGDGPRA